MNEVKIQIPDNCELIKDGNTYIVKEKEEKKQTPPRSWKEFCEKYPITQSEAYIGLNPGMNKSSRNASDSKNWCTSKEEAEAFLALMQLRQLRKAWIGDWEPFRHVKYSVIFVEKRTNKLKVDYGYWEYNFSMAFPSKEIAEDFLNCFRDLCVIAKPLL